jgi:outer membrane protein assembly factor BamB
MCSALVVSSAGATPSTAQTTTWAQFQGNEQRAGLAPEGTAEPPYAVAWDAAAGIGDPSQVAGIPSPILTDGLAIVVGRASVDAVDTSTGQRAWSVPRALGPSSPPALDGDLVLFLEGGGDDTDSGSSSPTSTAPSGSSSPTSATPSGSATPSPGAAASVSSLVAIDLRSQERMWSVPLSDVSRTGVLVVGQTAIVGADDGTVTAVDRAGEQLWSQHIGDQVLAPMAASGDQVYAAVRPASRGAASLVALHATDGSQAWRYEPGTSVLDLGAPSVVADAAGDTVYVVGSDASVRAVAATDGSQRWAVPVYAPTSGSPPAVSADAVYVTDGSGTVYAFDRATGQERWRFATNHGAVAAPILTAGSVIQAATDGTISAIGVQTGHQIWHATVADNAILGVAAALDLLVLAHTGTTPGLVALRADPQGATEDLTSPTTPDPVALLGGWLLVALPMTLVLIGLGRRLASRMGPPVLGAADDEPVDPWDAEIEDEP